MKIRILIGVAVVTLIALTSCEKQEGKGGTSTITGKVIVHEYNKDFTIVRDTIPGAREDVYLIYGDDAVYGDDFEAHYDGTYEFKYLREGSYKVFVYSKDSTLNYDLTDHEIPVIREVEITGKNQTVEVPDIIILK